jgi:SAM-dependent methyltransferase
MARVDYERMAASYDAGRAVPLAALEGWHAALRPYFPRRGDRRILDLGSGTGLFSLALARWFAAQVVGVEPAEAMRRAAHRERPHPTVLYVGGRAEALPLQDQSCDLAWLSTVIHHVDDLGACARELRRVVRSGGRVLIRTAFPGRLDDIPLFRFFPGAQAVCETFPTLEVTRDTFAAAGFAAEHLERVTEVDAPSLRSFCERVRTRADSTLSPLTDEEFALGMERLEAEVAREMTPTPVVSGLDLLVLR